MSGNDPYGSPANPNDPSYQPVPRETPKEGFDRIKAMGDTPPPAGLDAQPVGMMQSATIVTLITGAVAFLGTLGVKWNVDNATAQKIADALIILIPLVTPALGILFRVRAASIVVPGASAPKHAVAAAKSRRDAIKSKATPSRTVPGIVALIASMAMLAGFHGGCQMLGGGNATTQPANMSPIVRVYVARQVYTSALPALSAAINAGMLDDQPAVLKGLAVAQTTVENALNQAEAYAVQGKAADFNYWINQVDTALSEFLKLSRPGTRAIPMPRPATRPASWVPSPERIQWVLRKSSPSSPRQPASSTGLSASPTRSTTAGS